MCKCAGFTTTSIVFVCIADMRSMTRFLHGDRELNVVVCRMQIAVVERGGDVPAGTRYSRI